MKNGFMFFEKIKINFSQKTKPDVPVSHLYIRMVSGGFAIVGLLDVIL
jgi:hypothetical protein